jgi:tryptophanyl-tRNA synthetase
MTTRVISGTTPSGRLTIGNYLGAIQGWVRNQQQTESIFFASDLHALTTRHDPALVNQRTYEIIGTLLAAGLDPQVCTLFVQSHVPAHAELSYLLECTAYDGELRRMIQYKEKSKRAEQVRASLLTYPVLMAADILLYEIDEVPVGHDQRQHVELTRDIATRFNALYGPTFVVPQARTSTVGARIMDLADPTRKMDKSAPPDAPGVVFLLDPIDEAVRKIGRAVTDSDGQVCYDPDANPGVANLLQIIAACEGERTDPGEVAGRYASYQQLKQAAAASVVEVLEPLQKRYAEVMADRPALNRLLADGAARARAMAAPVLARAMAAIGLAEVSETAPATRH